MPTRTPKISWLQALVSDLRFSENKISKLSAELDKLQSVNKLLEEESSKTKARLRHTQDELADVEVSHLQRSETGGNKIFCAVVEQELEVLVLCLQQQVKELQEEKQRLNDELTALTV